MKTIKQCILLFSAGLILITSGCIEELRVKGNGIEATEGRMVSDFARVKSAGSFDVHITKGDEFEVIVSADENVIEHIETYVSGDVLKIETKGTLSIKNKLPMEVFITMPNMRGLKLSGSGKITTDYFHTNQVDILLSGSGKIETAFEADEANVDISGSGEVELSGFANKSNFRISGSGTILADELETTDCYTVTSGSGDMWISIERSLDARITGSGNVYYYGNPEVDTTISGSGYVKSIN